MEVLKTVDSPVCTGGYSDSDPQKAVLKNQNQNITQEPSPRISKLPSVKGKVCNHPWTLPFVCVREGVEFMLSLFAFEQPVGKTPQNSW